MAVSYEPSAPSASPSEHPSSRNSFESQHQSDRVPGPPQPYTTHRISRTTNAASTSTASSRTTTTTTEILDADAEESRQETVDLLRMHGDRQSRQRAYSMEIARKMGQQLANGLSREMREEFERGRGRVDG